MPEDNIWHRKIKFWSIFGKDMATFGSIIDFLKNFRHPNCGEKRLNMLENKTLFTKWAMTNIFYFIKKCHKIKNVIY